MKKLAGILTLGLAAACGGGGGDPDATITPHPDANTTDAAPTCTQVTVGTTDIVGGNDNAIFWQADVNEDLGDGGATLFQYQFYAGFEPGPLLGDFDLTAAPDDNFSTCGACLLVFSLDAAGAAARTFFQTGGSLTLNADPFATPEPSIRTLDSSLTGLQLSEVTIDPDTAESTLVPGGECLTLSPSPSAVVADDVPEAWTCALDAFADQANCDCICGVSDADCNTHANPVNGCTGPEVCYQDACAGPVANDTCQTAPIALTLGTPVTGTTVNAQPNYDAGLEGCTGFAQPGADVAYQVVLTAGQNVTVSLTGADPTFDAAVALVGPGTAGAVCGATIDTCVAGSDAGLGGDDEITAPFTVVTTGTYFIIVDSYAPDGVDSWGNFTLTVTAT